MVKKLKTEDVGRPWENPAVRNDVKKLFNLRLPESYHLKLKYIIEHQDLPKGYPPMSMHNFCLHHVTEAIDSAIEALTNTNDRHADKNPTPNKFPPFRHTPGGKNEIDDENYDDTADPDYVDNDFDPDDETENEENGPKKNQLLDWELEHAVVVQDFIMKKLNYLSESSQVLIKDYFEKEFTLSEIITEMDYTQLLQFNKIYIPLCSASDTFDEEELIKMQSAVYEKLIDEIKQTYRKGPDNAQLPVNGDDSSSTGRMEIADSDEDIMFEDDSTLEYEDEDGDDDKLENAISSEEYFEKLESELTGKSRELENINIDSFEKSIEIIKVRGAKIPSDLRTKLIDGVKHKERLKDILWKLSLEELEHIAESVCRQPEMCNYQSDEIQYLRFGVWEQLINLLAAKR